MKGPVTENEPAVNKYPDPGKQAGSKYPGGYKRKAKERLPDSFY